MTHATMAPMPLPDDEQRLYLWVRALGAAVLLATLVFAVVAVVLLPALVPGYHLGEGTVVIVLGTLGTSALALVGVQSNLRRNGK